MGAPDEWGDELQSPIPFGNYLLLHRLGRGGMGEVYLAKITGLPGIDKLCVVKTLRANVASDKEYVHRFIDEARVVVQLTHRNICSVFDVGQNKSQKQYYLAMDYIAGHNVRELITQVGALEEGAALWLLTEMLEALDFAHRLKDPQTGQKLHIVHRDVSPQNVMATLEGEVKLIDFGLATSIKKSMHTEPNVVMGKMAYMSPEQARGEEVDPRTDLYAAAIVGVEMLTGARFYEGLTVDDIWRISGRGGFRPPGYALLDKGLRKILDKALAVRADERYASCSDFRDAVLDYALKHGIRVDSRALRTLMQERFGEEIDIAREVLARFSAPSLQSFVARLDDEESQSQSFAVSAKMAASLEESSTRNRVHDEKTQIRTERTHIQPLDSHETTEQGEAVEVSQKTLLVSNPYEAETRPPEAPPPALEAPPPEAPLPEAPPEATPPPRAEPDTAPTEVRPPRSQSEGTVVVRDRGLVVAPPPPARGGGLRFALLGGMIVVLGLLAGGLFVLRGDPPPPDPPVTARPVEPPDPTPDPTPPDPTPPVETTPPDPTPVETPPAVVDAGAPVAAPVEAPPDEHEAIESPDESPDKPIKRRRRRRPKAAVKAPTAADRRTPMTRYLYLKKNCQQTSCARTLLDALKQDPANPASVTRLEKCMRTCQGK